MMKQIILITLFLQSVFYHAFSQGDFSSTVLHQHKAEVYTIACSPDGEWLASGGNDKVINLYHLKKKKHSQRLVLHHKLITNLAFDASGKLLASTGADGKMCLWETETGKLIASIDNEKTAENSDFIALHFVFFFENYVYFGGDGAFLMRADITLPKPKAEVFFTVPSNFIFKTLRSGVISTDKNSIFLASGTDIYKISTSNAEVTGIFRHHQEINHLNFTPDGKYLCSWHYDGKIAFWNPFLGRTEKHIQVAKQHHYGEVRFSPDGNFLITGNSDFLCKVWDLRDGMVSGILAGHRKPVRTYTYTPDGAHVITGGYDGEVRMWKKMFKTAEELVAFEEIDISATEEASLKKGTVIKLPRLFFENNNEKILSAAETDLQQLYLLLLKNPDLKVELCGHSDSSAESEHGLRLSERRAEAVKKYLVERGIAAFRLPVRAFGGAKPLYTTQKELRKYNRRVDAVVIND